MRLPGSAITTRPRITPAAARERIARGPIWSHESRRNASPKPSSVLSKSGVSTSTVRSRGATPVPPVSTSASTPESSARATTASRMTWSSSRTMACETTSKPAAPSSSPRRRPPSSSAGVRVSLSVRVATRTGVLLTPEIYARPGPLATGSMMRSRWGMESASSSRSHDRSKRPIESGHSG